jgi:hypothetical protein
MIFDAYIWAQLELQLSIICASLPALRVFLRRYLSVSFTRSAMRSGFSRRSEQISQKSGDVNMRVISISNPIPISEAMREDFDAKYNATRPLELEELGVGGNEHGMRSRSPSAPSEARLFKEKYNSEAWNEAERDGDERSIYSPSFERKKSWRGRNNFSQPLPKSMGF